MAQWGPPGPGYGPPPGQYGPPGGGPPGQYGGGPPGGPPGYAQINIEVQRGPPGGCGGPPGPGYGPPGGGPPGYGGPPPPGPGYGPPGGGPPGYGGPPPGGGWGGPPGPSYNEGPMYGGGQQEQTMDIFVEATPEIQPNFQRGPNGTFEMFVQGVRVRLATSCNPPPHPYPGLVPFKPHEEFMVQLPEVQRVVFDPRANQPPNGRAWCNASKRGAVIELPPHITMNAKLKTDSPYGSLILEDMSIQGDYKQKVGETVLNYRLQVDGQLSVGHGSGNNGANRLEVELNFVFDCYLGGPPVAQPSGPPQSSYGGPPPMGGPPMGGPPMGGPPMGGPPMGGPPMGGPPMGPPMGGPPGYGGPPGPPGGGYGYGKGGW